VIERLRSELIRDSRASAFENFINLDNERRSFLSLSDYSKLTGTTFVEREKFLKAKKFHATKIKRNLLLLSKVKALIKRKEVEGLRESPIKRKALPFAEVVPPAKRMLKSYLKRESGNVGRTFKKKNSTKSLFSPNEVHWFYRVVWSKSSRKNVKLVVRVPSKKENMSDMRVSSVSKEKMRRNRNRGIAETTLWDYIAPKLPATIMDKTRPGAPKIPTRLVLAKRLPRKKDKLVASANPEKVNNIETVVSPVHCDFSFEEKPATWLVTLKTVFINHKQRIAYLRKERLINKLLVDYKRLIVEFNSKDLLPSIRETINHGTNEKTECVSVRDKSVVLLQKGKIRSNHQSVNHEPSIKFLKRLTMRHSSFENQSSGTTTNLPVWGHGTLQTTAVNKATVFGRMDSDLFVHGLFEQDHCLFCQGHSKPYKWGGFKRKRLGNTKDFFPQFVWKSSFGRISINIFIELLDQICVFPGRVLYDFILHFFISRHGISHITLSKLFSSLFRREIEIKRIVRHNSTSFTPFLHSSIQWVFVFPKYITKLCSYTSEESDIILKTLIAGWLGMVLVFMILCCVISKFIPAIFSNSVASLLRLVFMRVKKEVPVKNPVWEGPFVKELLEPCKDNNLVLRSMCKLIKIRKLLNVISNRETNTHLNLDTVLGNTGVGFYASFTWWSYLISSLSCVQGIAKAMYEYKTLNSTGSVQTIQLLLVLCKFIVYCIFFVTNTVMVSKFLNSNILELVFFVAGLTIMFHLSSKLLTYVFSYDCSWIKSLSDVPKLQYGDTGKLIKYRKMEQPIVRSKETAVIFSSKNEQIMVGRKSVRLISIMSGFKSCAEIVLVGCAFLWLIDSVSNPYKFYLKKEGLRLFFGSGGKKFLYLNLASVVVTMLGFSENFSVILSPLVFLLYLCFEHREDILLYFGKDIQNLFYGSQELSTIVYHFPGMSRYINLELFSLIGLLLMEYVLAFLQLSSSRILGKFYTATFRFLNIYLIYMAILALKTFVENLPKFMYSSVITWFFLAFVTRTTIGCSALVKTSSITKDGDNNFFSVAKKFFTYSIKRNQGCGS
jgi:hypothetical protein